MQSIDLLSNALRTAYEWNHSLAVKLVDHPLVQPVAGKGNHAMWVVGHVTLSTASLLTMISGRSHDLEAWRSLFEGGTIPALDASRYPAYREVLARYARVQEEAQTLLKEVGEAGLDEAPAQVWPALKDDPDFQTRGRLFLFMAMHEMSHRGQLADAARVAGIV